MRKKILLFGAQGMLGMQFLYDFEEEFEIIPFSRFNLDLEETESILPEILNIKPDVIVNTAAWTTVDKAENSQFQPLVRKINIEAPREMARAAKKLRIPFFHTSTDFVFNGSSKNDRFNENAKKNPSNFYGLSKSLGEDAVREEHENSYIVRTAWLYGAYGPNFISRLRQSAKTQSEIRVVNDQFGNPTWTKEVVKILAFLINDAGQNYPSGVYHAVSEVGTNPPSWYDFAAKVFAMNKIRTPLVAIASKEYATIAQRPPSSVLVNTKLPAAPSWEKMLTAYFSAAK